jgi:predicted Zn-dependent protease with MMP-like domain
MAVRALDKAKVEFLQRYTNEEIFDIIFTDYNNIPSELTKVADLELLVKENISQLINALGIEQVFTLKDLFENVNQVRIEVETTEEVAVVEDTAGVEDTGAVLDYAGGGG